MTQEEVTGIDVTPEKNGGVMKEILREGSGDEFPQTGDKVYVHYVGTLTDGSVFDSSRERDEKFSFSLGKGSVIKAWDLGVATMKKGELARLTCKPEYAYGKNGSPPKIGPDATLIFEVELFEWKREDISPNKDEGILRRIVKSGEGRKTPNEGATVNVHYIGYHENQKFEERDVTFVVGEVHILLSFIRLDQRQRCCQVHLRLCSSASNSATYIVGIRFLSQPSSVLFFDTLYLQYNSHCYATCITPNYAPSSTFCCMQLSTIQPRGSDPPACMSKTILVYSFYPSQVESPYPFRTPNLQFLYPSATSQSAAPPSSPCMQPLSLSLSPPPLAAFLSVPPLRLFTNQGVTSRSASSILWCSCFPSHYNCRTTASPCPSKGLIVIGYIHYFFLSLSLYLYFSLSLSLSDEMPKYLVVSIYRGDKEKFLFLSFLFLFFPTRSLASICLQRKKKN
ncbi:FKBP4_5 [Acanthosepion pharaonis]|uniref:peptidylprolyl isomerase n=1 Tax=Acanthosepion pharaonis TaxID=158019 RepID=A0A812DSV2_ACAPH|nr:FKBP4_5 [Sepia pharaonis]